jgi:hypothetical protein
MLSLIAVAIAGCAAQKVSVDTPFDAGQAADLMKPGVNTIKGSALIRQRAGTVVTCAGREVRLIPATGYAKRRMEMIYGSSTYAASVPTFEYTHPGYLALTRSTTCNAQGFFAFDRVADGDFFVATSVTWEAGYTTQGGALMHRVAVAGGEMKEIVLTPN